MPRINADYEEYEEQLDEFEGFASGFQPSKRKPQNVWRHWDDLTLVVFQRNGDGRWGWSIADEDGPRFSQRTFETQEDALSGLWHEIGDIQ